MAPFNLIELDSEKSSRVQSYSLALEFQETQSVPVKLVPLNVSDSKNSISYLEVVGEVENQGDAPSSYAKIVGTFYDDAGKVIYVGFTFTNPDTIPPASRYSFKLIVLSDERSSKIVGYSLVTESQEYTSVPESPWPILLATLTLTLALDALKRKKHG